MQIKTVLRKGKLPIIVYIFGKNDPGAKQVIECDCECEPRDQEKWELPDYFTGEPCKLCRKCCIRFVGIDPVRMDRFKDWQKTMFETKQNEIQKITKL